MKVIIILATGSLLTFPTIENIKPDCFGQGHKILENIAMYYGPGPDQGWFLNGSKVGVAGWYCR